MAYTLSALGMVAIAGGIDLLWLRTRLLCRRAFWTAYAIILFFQLIMNGVLTGLPVVTYEESEISGIRIVNAPVEDVAFGFALALVTLSCWVWRGRVSRNPQPRHEDSSPSHEPVPDRPA